MATCTGSMLSLPSTSYQSLRVRAATNKGRSLCSLKGRSCSLGGVSLPELAWKAVNKELVAAAAAARSYYKGSVRKTCVCSATTSGGEERPQEQASAAAVKLKEAGNVLLKLLPRLLPAIAIFVVSWLIRRPNLALAGVETPNFVVGGEAAQAGSGVLSREISRGGGGLLASAWTGLVAGGLHTLTGPDHLAALAPLCIGRSRLQSFSVGALWGCGHDAGQVIFGIIFLLLKDRLHLDIIQTWAARVVGLTLITIGGMGIKEAQEIEQATPALVEGADGITTVEEPGKKSVGPATFITGIVYGLQPDALLMVLPALSLPSRAAGAAFLGMFLLGTVLAMGSYTAFVSSLSKALQKRVPKITHRLTIGSSLVAIGLGLAVLLGEVFGINIF